MPLYFPFNFQHISTSSSSQVAVELSLPTEKKRLPKSSRICDLANLSPTGMDCFDLFRPVAVRYGKIWINLVQTGPVGQPKDTSGWDQLPHQTFLTPAIYSGVLLNISSQWSLGFIVQNPHPSVYNYVTLSQHSRVKPSYGPCYKFITTRKEWWMFNLGSMAACWSCTKVSSTLVVWMAPMIVLDEWRIRKARIYQVSIRKPWLPQDDLSGTCPKWQSQITRTFLGTHW